MLRSGFIIYSQILTQNCTCEIKLILNQKRKCKRLCVIDFEPEKKMLKVLSVTSVKLWFFVCVCANLLICWDFSFAER